MIQRFSPKQRQVLRWWSDSAPERGRDAIICDGAVRSGKTLCLGLSFFLWGMARYRGQQFALCGKTTESVRRNLLSSVLPLLGELGFQWEEKVSRNKLLLRLGGRENTFFLFGGKDEGSAALIQGVTLAGVLLDEVALMPRSFVEQACARCSVEGSKLWFNCNPEGPSHWFYLSWVLGAKERNMLHLHFTMDDNLSLSPAVKARYESLYSGVFYDRFIRGLWVVAEGLIYTMFNKDFHVVRAEARPYDKYYISCDYGTVNPTSIGLWGRANGKWYRMREYYFDSRKEGRQRTDEEHYTELEKLAADLHITAVIVDPSAASFIEVIRRHGRFRVEKASNAVVDGIRNVATRLQCGDIFICEGCTDCIREFGLYRWDEKATADRPIKENDHSMDDVRYFVHKVFAPELFSFK